MAPVRAFSTLGCPQATLDETFALADRFGVERIELRALGGTTDLAGYFAGRHGTPQALGRALGERSRRIAGIGSSLRLSDSSESDRAAFLALVPWAEAAGAPWIRIFDGPGGGEARSRAEAWFEWWRGVKRERGWTIRVLVETHDSALTVAGAEELLKADPEAALLWDAHHTWRKGAEDPVETWRALQPRIGHVHVKDSAARPGGGPGFAYVLPGEGEFPMARLRPELALFPGAVSLEWEKLWHPELPELDRALSAAAEARWW